MSWVRPSVPLFHLLAVVFVHKPAPYEGAQNAAANPGLYRLGILPIQLLDREEAYAVDDADMEMGVLVERRAEAMDEGHRTGTCIRPCARALRTQMALDLVEEDAQGAVERLAVMLEVVTQPFWKRQDPLLAARAAVSRTVRNAGMWTVGVAVSGTEVGLSREEWKALPPVEQTKLRRHAYEKRCRPRSP